MENQLRGANLNTRNLGNTYKNRLVVNLLSKTQVVKRDNLYHCKYRKVVKFKGIQCRLI